MERPSHMSFPQLCLPCRLPMVAAALSFQVLVFWLFANGTGTRIIEIIRGPVVVKFEKSQLPKTPPPTEPKLERLQPIVAIPPEIPTNAGSNDDPRITSVRDEPVTDTVPPAAAMRASSVATITSLSAPAFRHCSTTCWMSGLPAIGCSGLPGNRVEA